MKIEFKIEQGVETIHGTAVRVSVKAPDGRVYECESIAHDGSETNLSHEKYRILAIGTISRTGDGNWLADRWMFDALGPENGYRMGYTRNRVIADNELLYGWTPAELLELYNEHGKTADIAWQ